MRAQGSSAIRSSPRVRAIAAALLAVQAALLLHASRASFVTADEPGHFAAAIAQWRRGAFDLYRVNPPLPRMLSVLPVLGLGPALGLGVAEDDTHHHPELAGARDERQLGEDLAAANAGGYLALIRIARLVAIGWTVLGGWIVFAWSRALFGDRAALVALALWCFEPNVLAHGCLITPDMPATVLGLAAMWMLSRQLARPSWGRTSGAGLVLGAALLAKFTNLYLLMAWPVLAVIAARGGGWPARRTAARRLAVIAAIALAVVNLGYGCRGTLTPLGALEFTSAALSGDRPIAPATPWSVATGNRFRDRWLGALPIPVPADYARGLDVQRRDFEHRFQSYLDGQWRDHGWWYYYLYALALKLPLGALGLILAGIGLAIRGGDARRLAWWCVVAPIALVLVLVSSQSGFNAHLRYVLPIFPFLAICAGRAAQHARGAQIWAIAVALLASAGSSLRVYPDTLAYFNEIAGGPGTGDDHLLDSNLDWGQDALALQRWIERHAPDARLGLAYFGGADPGILGLRFELPPRDVPGLRFATAEAMRAVGPHPGLFALSVNFLRGLSFDAPDGRGGWRPVSAGDYGYFRRFEPIATAGYSIRIYCIDAERANAVRAELGLIALAPQAAALDCEQLARGAVTD
jgi:hypothetical protein